MGGWGRALVFSEVDPEGISEVFSEVDLKCFEFLFQRKLVEFGPDLFFPLRFEVALWCVLELIQEVTSKRFD